MAQRWFGGIMYVGRSRGFSPHCLFPMPKLLDRHRFSLTELMIAAVTPESYVRSFTKGLTESAR